MGVTGILLTCSYNDEEFFRVGYYVNNYYKDPVLSENPPAIPDATKLFRNILTDKPRVTKFQIKWDAMEDAEHMFDTDNANQQSQEQAETMPAGTQGRDRNDMMSTDNIQAA